VLEEAGFDIAHAFDAHAVAREPGAAMREAAVENPLEAYTERVIDAVFPAARILYGHRRYDGAFVPLQRVAVATGLGALAPNGLVIHPEYGPWFALRAIVITDGEPVPRTPIAQPCTCTTACADSLARARAGGDWRAWLAVRDACSLRRWRYSEEQIRYHYTKTWDR
jgi:epoxyqueuosine reductase QueG